ncbi:hypothetical protein BN8_p06815 (plasmid) [Fibrisoma limi BUZ 3]|uniref:Uncharacterized protein n=1 Tax=Fibrisoma limi BUZ 3 TaxID=1185876 RepID=I2GU18_9BACT|nr:hypothetical protein [Fibrisoma limi]CCH57619.1 hypothetical protein BN8_p06815 [Fibrisoma limi BUZ 3]
MTAHNLIATYRLELTTINALNLLVHNYSQDDIVHLRQNRSFDHAWSYYWNGDEEGVTIEKFWSTWADKFDHQTQAFLLDFAMKRYGEEAYSNIDQATGWRDRLNQLLKEQYPDTTDTSDE